MFKKTLSETKQIVENTMEFPLIPTKLFNIEKVPAIERAPIQKFKSSKKI